MVNKLRRGMGFVLFTVRSVRPFSMVLLIITAKFIHKLLNIKLKNISLTFLSHKPLHITVNDIEQFTYLFNIFFSEPFKISTSVSSSPVIVDGGANIGMSSLYFHFRYPQGRIYAIEPSCQNIELLQRNLSEIPNLQIEQMAIWNESKELVFNISECTRYNSFFHTGEKCRAEKVKALCLSEWLDQKGLTKIDILKLNVEGAEANAIRGLGKRITDVGIIVGELHPQFVDKEMFIEELKGNNFILTRMEKMGKSTWSFEAYNPSFSQ